MSATLTGIFLDAVERHDKASQFLVKQVGEWRPISARETYAAVEAVALGLRAIGVARGDRVALLAETRYEWAVCDLAILGIGAVTVPIYPTLVAAQVARLMRDAEVRVAVVSNAIQREKARAARAEVPTFETVIEIDRAPTEPARPGELSLDEVRTRGLAAREGDANAFRASLATITPDDLATIIYTSGTTGDPKGAMLTHGNIASNVASCLEVYALTPADTCLSFLPLSHIFERMAGLYAMLAGGATIAYAENMEAVGANATEVHPTILTGVPRFYEKVYAKVMDSVSKRPPVMQRLFHWGLARGRARARAHFAGRALSPLAELEARLADRLVGRVIRERMGGRLRYGISGGAPLNPSVLEFFFAIGIPILEGYGLTETSPVICLNRPGHEKPGSVGPPIPGVEVRLGPEGEVLTRGPHVMRGYYHNPEATREAIRDGWFHTGDVGRIDADGCLSITDRIKDLLVTAGGKKVAPQPIEARLKESRWVGEAVLLGDRRPFVVCLLAPDFEQLETEARDRGWTAASRRALIERPEVHALYEAEIARVNASLAPFERIKKFDLIDHELTLERGELTPSLKVKRRVIAEHFGPAIEALYGAEPRHAAAAEG